MKSLDILSHGLYRKLLSSTVFSLILAHQSGAMESDMLELQEDKYRLSSSSQGTEAFQEGGKKEDSPLVISKEIGTCTKMEENVDQQHSKLHPPLHQIEELSQYIDKIETIIPLQQEEAILIVGDTGEGKSYLLNYLAEVQLTARKIKGTFGEYVVHTDNPLEGIEISHGTVSKTNLPFGWKEYWDCPGFGDTRGAIQNIVNAFSIYKLTKSSDKIKILVVVSENTIKGSRRSKFLNLVHTVGETFKNILAFTQSLGLVVTKNKELTSDLIREGFSSILEEQKDQENFTSYQKKILESLSSPKSKIAFFSSPKKEGEISDSDRILILRTVQEIPYLIKPQASIFISDEAKIFIKDLADRLNDDISKFISNEFYPNVLNYCNKLINNHLGTANELRRNLNSFSTSLKELSLKEEDFENDLQKILYFIKKLENKDLEDRLSKKIDRLNFLGLVKPLSLKIKGKTDSWSHYIKKSISDIDILSAPPERDRNGQYLTLKGLIIGANDINDVLYESQVSELNVYSLNSILVDEDIHAPSINLALISPQWRIIEKRIISLRGKNGSPHQFEKQDDGISGTGEQIHGRDGQPGLPGDNGGHIYVKGKAFYNLSSLTIDVRGGNGGKGQNGGDGAKGLDGGNGGLEDVEEGKELISRDKIKPESLTDYLEKGIKFAATFNDKFKEVYESYEPGKQGGNAGRGGIGGLGGKAGSVNIEGKSSQEPIILQNDGDRGLNGQLGNPGAGGRNGPTYRGVYINEVVAPTIRGYEETNTNNQVVSSITKAGAGAGAGMGYASATATKHVMSESYKVTMQHGVKMLSRDVTRSIYTEGSKMALSSGAKGTVREIAVEGGKAVVKLGSSNVASVLKGMGTSLVVQAIASPISAYFSSGWEEHPRAINDGLGSAPDGEIFFSFNERDIREPSNSNPPVQYQEKKSSYNSFYTQRSDLSIFILPTLEGDNQ